MTMLTYQVALSRDWRHWPACSFAHSRFVTPRLPSGQLPRAHAPLPYHQRAHNLPVNQHLLCTWSSMSIVLHPVRPATPAPQPRAPGPTSRVRVIWGMVKYLLDARTQAKIEVRHAEEEEEVAGCVGGVKAGCRAARDETCGARRPGLSEVGGS